jgi:hypothetical protein
MDWRRAAELVVEGYHRITSSIPVPLYCFDLWTLGYLMGQGLSLESLERFLRVGAEMLLAGLTVDAPPAPADFEPRLIAALREPNQRAATEVPAGMAAA